MCTCIVCTCIVCVHVLCVHVLCVQVSLTVVVEYMGGVLQAHSSLDSTRHLQLRRISKAILLSVSYAHP